VAKGSDQRGKSPGDALKGAKPTSQPPADDDVDWDLDEALTPTPSSARVTTFGAGKAPLDLSYDEVDALISALGPESAPPVDDQEMTLPPRASSEPADDDAMTLPPISSAPPAESEPPLPAGDSDIPPIDDDDKPFLLHEDLPEPTAPDPAEKSRKKPRQPKKKEPQPRAKSPQQASQPKSKSPRKDVEEVAPSVEAEPIAGDADTTTGDGDAVDGKAGIVDESAQLLAETDGSASDDDESQPPAETQTAARSAAPTKRGKPPPWGIIAALGLGVAVAAWALLRAPDSAESPAASAARPDVAASGSSGAAAAPTGKPGATAAQSATASATTPGSAAAASASVAAPASASASASAAAPASAAAAPGAAPDEPPGDGSGLLNYKTYLIVKSSADAEVVVQGVGVGRTNRKLEVHCRWRNLRLRASDGTWLSPGQTMKLPCQTVHTVTIEPEGG
jgi:hypothetical protein